MGDGLLRFHNRTNELDLIRRSFEGENCFIVVTGRRRIGKTRLIRESLKERDHLDFFIPRKRLKLALEQLSLSLEQQTGYSPLFRNMRDFFEYIFRLEDRIIFIDEISNLDFIEPGSFSDLQELYDRYKEEKNLKLVVDGSYVSIMKKIFLDAKQPLFGRATHVLKLEQLPVKHSMDMLMEGGFSFLDSLEAYSLFGGIPRYNELLGSFRNLEEIRERIFTPGSIFLSEGENLLVQEFGKSWDTNFSILEVIAGGNSGPSQIADKLGMDVTMLPKYLTNLRGLQLISRKTPLLGKEKHVRYKIRDNFFQFWFEICYPSAWLFKEGRGIIEEERFRTLIGRKMEDVFMDILIQTDSFPFQPDDVGKWWDRNGNEIDFLFYSKKEKKLGIGEIKWRKKPVDGKQVKTFMQNITLIDWHNEKRREYPFIVSKSGFTKGAIGVMNEFGISHFTINDIEKTLTDDTPLNWTG